MTYVLLTVSYLATGMVIGGIFLRITDDLFPDIYKDAVVATWVGFWPVLLPLALIALLIFRLGRVVRKIMDI